MENDKAFAIYALTLIGGIATLLAGTVAVGLASVPPLAFMAEHLGMGLAFRATYKSFDGSNLLVSALELSGMITAPNLGGAAAEAA
ncbi:MAG: hypothetical protein JRH19_24115 [Deltaproteobacteria bacterium]|nr:hypothetical protein [Deltaproteobacteria bacterium]